MKNFTQHVKLVSGAAALLLVVFSIVIQHFYQLEPCPLCITQRVIFLVSGLLFLFFAFKSLNKLFELITLLSINIIGMIFAIRHVLIQKKIIEIPSECGIDLEYMFDNFPLQEVFELVFRGTGDCSEIDWTLLHLTIPEWSAIWFFIFALLSILNYRNN